MNESNSTAEKLSESFDFTFHSIQNDAVEDLRYEFDHEFEHKSKCSILFDSLKSFIKKWIQDLSSLKLNTKESVSVFQLISNLIDKMNNVNIELLRDPENSMTPENTLSATRDLIRSEINMYDTRYKFEKKISSGAFYVHPIEKAVGTRYELKCSGDSKVTILHPVNLPICADNRNTSFAFSKR